MSHFNVSLNCEGQIHKTARKAHFKGKEPEQTQTDVCLLISQLSALLLDRAGLSAYQSAECLTARPSWSVCLSVS